MADPKDVTVGKLRQQTALCDADRRVVLISSDAALSTLLEALEITDVFPDSTDEHGNFGSTFKIRVGLRRKLNL